MTLLLITLIQFVFVLLVAPYFVGLVRLIKARFQGRKGANPLLVYYGLMTLLKKEMVISKSTSWVFRIVPFVTLASVLFLVFVLPLLGNGSLSMFGNLFIVAGVLMIGAVFLTLGGLDSASAFGGMGSEREMTIAALIEPAVICSFSAFAVITGPQIGAMISAGGSELARYPYLLLSIFALLLILLAENARYPVDNPATHLELTMVHEAMVLEYSGPYLAMLEYASAIKIATFALLISNFIVPVPLLEAGQWTTIPFALLVSMVKLGLFAFLIACIESIFAKMRFYRMQEYTSGAFFLGLTGLILALVHTSL